MLRLTLHAAFGNIDWNVTDNANGGTEIFQILHGALVGRRDRRAAWFCSCLGCSRGRKQRYRLPFRASRRRGRIASARSLRRPRWLSGCVGSSRRSLPTCRMRFVARCICGREPFPGCLTCKHDNERPAGGPISSSSARPAPPVCLSIFEPRESYPDEFPVGADDRRPPNFGRLKWAEEQFRKSCLRRLRAASFQANACHRRG